MEIAKISDMLTEVGGFTTFAIHNNVGSNYTDTRARLSADALPNRFSLMYNSRTLYVYVEELDTVEHSELCTYMALFFNATEVPE